ncbi:MAG TPA: fibronectin type III domain-containing protein, partial [Nakamurella sp.]|nr:fibronectin type III domain-containing protein [Nakamurella sp.]
MFTDSSGWYSQASYGALTQTGAVTPWLHIAAPAGNKCFGDMHNEMTTAKSAALAAGYNSANYDRTVLYFPNDSAANSDCAGYSGWASVSGTEIWLNGYMDRRVTVHEQGHNYGLLHANSLACKEAGSGNGIALASAANCVSTEYGDDYDAMGGSGYVGSFSGGEKNRMGWLVGHKAALAPGGTVTIAPLETAAAVNAAYFTASATRTYWLEYRLRIGIDAGLPAAVTDGVLIHLDDAAYRSKFELLDQKPASYNNFADATLGAGSSWTTPDGFTFVVTDVSPSGATVRLISGSPTTPGVPAAVAVTRNDAVATISWSAPASDGGSAITGYRVSRDGVDAGGTGPTSTVVSSSTGSYSFGTLRPGSRYALSVRAINAAGDGPAASGSVTTPATAPGVPTGVATSITASGSGTLTWAPPASDGGSAVTGYRVSRNGTDSTGAGPSSTLVSHATRSNTFATLRRGVSYTVSVQAVTAVGSGPAASATLTVQVGGAIVPVTPVRIADSRTALEIPGAVRALGSVEVHVTGQGGIPGTGVAAAVLTVTAVAPTADGYLTVWPAGTTRTDTSNLNFVAGQNIPNTVIVPVGDTGAVGIFNGS